MTLDVQAAVTLVLRDRMSGRAQKALQKVSDETRAGAQASREAGRTAAQAGQAQEKAANRVAQAERKAAVAARQAKEERARANAQAAQGMQRLIQVEQQLAQATKKTASVSFSPMLNTLKKVEQQARKTMQSMRGGVNAIASIGGGVAAGVGVAAMAAKKPIDYEKRLALMANTAFADRKTLEGRKAGMQELRATVDNAVRVGGGTRESAAEALDAMIASGAVGIDSAKGMLPTIQKFASATGAESTEIADIAIRGIQNKFFKPEQLEEALNKALVAGQEGGFELKDMARWLPQLMASAQGMQSMQGFERILASAQASMTTAGSKDQAGNNLVNLLTKINSKETKDRFAKEHGIDLAATLAKGTEQGKTTLDTFIEVINQRVIGKDKRVQELRKKAASAKGEEQQQILNDIESILKASAIGEIVADRQALMGLLAEMSQGDYIKKIQEELKNSAGAVDLNHELTQSTTAASIERAANEKDMAMQNALDDASPMIKLFTDGVTAASREFPTLTTVVAEAATAIASLAAAGAVMGGIGMLTGGRGGVAKGAGSLLGGLLRGGKAAANAPARIAQGVGNSLKGGARQVLGKVAPAAMVIDTAMSARDIYNNDNLTGAQKGVEYTSLLASFGGAWAGMKAGALGGGVLGSAVPGVGTAAGGFAGGIAGGIAGFIGGEELVRAFAAEIESVFSGIFGGQKPPDVNVKVTLDGRELTASIDQMASTHARRY